MAVETGRDVRALLKSAAAARREKDFPAVLAILDEALAMQPEQVQVRLEHANALRDVGRLAEADQSYSALVRDHPDHAPTHFQWAYCARKQGDRARSLAGFRQSFALDPDRRIALLEIARDLAETGALHEADQAYRRYVQDEPDQFRARIEWARVLNNLGRTEDYGRELTAAFSLAPGHTLTALGLARFLSGQGRAAEAITILSDNLPASTQPARIMLELARLCRLQGDAREASTWLDKAMAADGDNPDTALAVAHIDVAERRWNNAGERLRRVLSKHPADVRVLTAYANFLATTKDFAGALNYVQLAVDGSPNSADLQIELSRIAFMCGEVDRAIAISGRLCETDANNLRAATAHIDQLIDANRLAEAYQFLEKRPSGEYDASIVRRHVRLLTKDGRLLDATACLKTAIERIGFHQQLVAIYCQLQLSLGRIGAFREMIGHLKPGSGDYYFLSQMQMHLIDKDFVAARDLLEYARQARGADSIIARRLAALIHEGEGHYVQAAQALDALCDADPYDSSLITACTRLLFFTFNSARIRVLLQRQKTINASQIRLSGSSPNISQSLIGQLADEVDLQPQLRDELQAAALKEHGWQLAYCRKALKDNPEYTPLSMLAVNAMRKAVSPASAQAGARAIPRMIHQYWDSENPPSLIQNYMNTWRTLNPSFEYKLYNRNSASAFIRENFGRAEFAAFRRCAHPAKQADYFRLAIMTKRGGYYADADDVALSPFERIFGECSLGVYQENLGTIGNNVIAAIPDHPAIRLCLELATEAINRGDSDMLWLTTGPGLMTRAIARTYLSQDEEAPIFDGLRILTHFELRAHVAIHCRSDYKSSKQNWSKAEFGGVEQAFKEAPTLDVQADR